jgi:hypothetical protein
MHAGPSRRMDPLWSPAVATASKRSRREGLESPLETARSFATGCQRLPPRRHSQPHSSGADHDARESCWYMSPRFGDCLLERHPRPRAALSLVRIAESLASGRHQALVALPFVEEHPEAKPMLLVLRNSPEAGGRALAPPLQQRTSDASDAVDLKPADLRSRRRTRARRQSGAALCRDPNDRARGRRGCATCSSAGDRSRVLVNASPSLRECAHPPRSRRDRGTPPPANGGPLGIRPQREPARRAEVLVCGGR